MTRASSSDKPSKPIDELMSTPIDFSAYIMNGLKITNLTQETLLRPAFKLLKGTHSNFAELEYDFEECIEDMVQNIWSPIKVSYDKYALWGISYWRKQRMTFYAYAQGLESSHDVYSTKHILAVTRVEVMRKHGLTNLSGDDVSDFAIALQMFTRIMVIQKRVEDLQIGVESYQKKINVTKPKNMRLNIKKRDPYTPYQDPQGFIYVDSQGRNRLMRLDELYKFSDGTSTRLRTSLDDITKNIQMEYLP
ncbi:hypothetical protein Tco_0845644 [Tanacetum coccineum]